MPGEGFALFGEDLDIARRPETAIALRPRSESSSLELTSCPAIGNITGPNNKCPVFTSLSTNSLRDSSLLE
jgi:hypothetical protein